MKSLPKIVKYPVKMDHPNADIEIYTGEFTLESDKYKIKINGELKFKWLPSIGATFTGTVQSGAEKLLKDDLDSNYRLIINEIDMGDCFIVNLAFTDEREHPKVKGIFTKHFTFGDHSIPVESISFAIPNLISFRGATVATKDDGLSFANVRTTFENKDFIIILDKSPDYIKRREKLYDEGGYFLFYAGSLAKREGNLNLTESRELFFCFDIFLTFLQGQRAKTVFHSGLFEDERAWTDYSNYRIQSFKSTFSWTLYHSSDGLSDLFNNFYSLWKGSSQGKDFLISVVHWYIEANNNSGYTEGSIILSQVALELLYNWLVVEKYGLLHGKDAASISASNKIRLLLSKLDISTKVPHDFIHLKRFVDSEADLTDAPDCITTIRNALVHSQIEKREKILKISLDIKLEALQVSLWYIELSLLYILGYEGKYSNRCIKKPFPMDREMLVPWMNGREVTRT
ncbi:MAG: hypothetical protein AAF489_16610 [Bacteroidota bacterium]